MDDGVVTLGFVALAVLVVGGLYASHRENRDVDVHTSRGCIYVSHGASDKKITADAVALRREGDTNWYCPVKIEE